MSESFLRSELRATNKDGLLLAPKVPTLSDSKQVGGQTGWSCGAGRRNGRSGEDGGLGFHRREAEMLQGSLLRRSAGQIRAPD